MKKIVCSLICFLTLTLITTITYATESYSISEYNEFKDAISNNESNKLITLYNDIEILDEEITIKKDQNVTIDLNGHVITMNSQISNTSSLLKNSGTLTIEDSSDLKKDGTGNGKIVYVSAHPDTNNMPGYASNVISNYGNLNVKSGKIINNTGSGSATYGIDNYSNNATLKIDGGYIFSKNSCGIRMFVNDSILENNFVMNGGTIEGKRGLQMQVANSSPKASIKIDDGIIKGQTTGLYIYDYTTNSNNVNVIINGGNFSANKQDGAAIYIYDVNANVKINGGTFDGYYALEYFAYNQASEVTNIINGGIFNRILRNR